MKLIVETHPHIKAKYDRAWLMREVIVGLSPVILASLFFFRIRAFLLIGICVLSCVLTEEVFLYLRRKPSAYKDGSAVVTGILLALTLPPKIPLWMGFLGGFVAIFIGKQLFGGLGQNIFNPALVGRAFLMASFPVALTTWHNPFTLEAVTEATPLALAKFSKIFVSWTDLFLGRVSGSLGETSALAILIGGGYLLVRRVADWRQPLGMFLGMGVLSGIFFLEDPLNGSILFHLFSGGAMLGMFFMVTDPVTTPVTKLGRFMFGLGVGMLVMIIRKWGGLPEGVMYSILFMNGLVPLINKWTKPKSFGR